MNGQVLATYRAILQGKLIFNIFSVRKLTNKVFVQLGKAKNSFNQELPFSPQMSVKPHVFAIGNTVGLLHVYVVIPFQSYRLHVAFI